MSTTFEQVFHVTVLSNFARAYDKYSRSYLKELIPESTFPDQFFVLQSSELQIGIDKANALLARLALPGDRLLILSAQLPSKDLHANLRTGKGRYLASSRLPVHALYVLDASGQLAPIIAEEAYADSLAVLVPILQPYTALAPRTISVLPIARACQAACKFCFSESSASLEQVPHRLNLDHIAAMCKRAQAAGAQRFVITGGGEPGLIKHSQMLDLIHLGHQYFDKVVLITNGYHLARLTPEKRQQAFIDYAQAGLGILSISRHSQDSQINCDIMGLDTGTELILEHFQQSEVLTSIRLRLICVLQKGGVENDDSLARYLDWACTNRVGELCFKELYVSTTSESVYHAQQENQWSLTHQVSLALITSFLPRHGFKITSRLPWGAPIFAGKWNGQPMTIAAYTEPSLFWERSQGIARSWNIMADGSCLVSLEDPRSALPQPHARPTITIMTSQ